ncbi:pyridoxal phosphate-dependent transferase [Dichomitus squalens]|uniref:Pyridoxal phosphate-dependent transferase n=1 Tax=Dichomitus squalens TaxID=114155 RepID=A0A4Q9P7D9_9APHY|nr:pyridoxal phosphate-dependent transferase [Dichomitus squalens]TBU65341.1 pyridoxal phosphate-dependent transferase [Dichomitus squalens]
MTVVSITAMSTPVDLTHHLSTEARLRKPNPMKEIWKLTRRRPNMVSLANGDPHFSLYPIRSIEYEMASVAVKDPVASWRAGPSAPSHTMKSSAHEPCALPIQAGMQYSHGTGLPDAQRVVTELTQFYHAPADHLCTLALGNSDGITKCFRILGEPGDTFIADEFTFSSVTNVPLAQGIKWAGIKMDEGGMIPSELERTLATWDPARGRRPHVMYLIPCGQNPTGSTLSLERRKQIYAIAQRYDLIIIEDDPYYFLQYDAPSRATTSPDTPFVRSFLSLDTDGRVMRIDSFSKIMAPGMRLGWITSNATFHDALVTYTDSSTMHPHGFGQMLITEMLAQTGWGLAGFDRWVRSLRAEYHRRRAHFLALFEREVAPTGIAGAECPEAGMFVWIRVHVEKHPRYRADRRMASKDVAGPRTNVKELMEELFERCLDGGLVIMPASIFALSADPKFDDMEDPVEDRVNYLRATFAGTEEVMEQGLAILGRVLEEFFAEELKVFA